MELTCGAEVVLADDLPSHVAKRSHTVVCVRPCVTAKMERTLRSLRVAGVRLIADYDDLLFAGNVSGLPASVARAGGGSEATQLARYAAGLDAFDHFVVSTRSLATQLRQRRPGAPISVVPNGLSRVWVGQGRTLYPRFRVGDPLVVRYFSGSPSHDRDFASILPALNAFLAEYPQVALEIVGPLTLPFGALPAGRVSRRPRVGYEQLAESLAATWVNLAPLAPTEFNDSKSAIKFLESGAFGCPTLASANDDLLRHQELGAHAILCKTEHDWYRELTNMLQSERRQASGRSAEQHVAAHGMAAAHAHAWLQAIRPPETPWHASP